MELFDMTEERMGFRVGDTVVLEDYADEKLPDDPGWVRYMNEMIGNVYIIKEFCDGHNPWCFLKSAGCGDPLGYMCDLRWLRHACFDYDCNFEYSISDLI